MTRVDPLRDRTELIDFLTGNRFPHHVTAALTPAEAASRVDRGDFGPGANVALWLEAAGEGRIGIGIIQGATDSSPEIDLRLAERFRGRRLGRVALRAVVDHAFLSRPELRRIEGSTREDNWAMIRTFEACGFVREAVHREAWPSAEGWLSSVGYAMLRRDWRGPQ